MPELRVLEIEKPKASRSAVPPLPSGAAGEIDLDADTDAATPITGAPPEPGSDKQVGSDVHSVAARSRTMAPTAAGEAWYLRIATGEQFGPATAEVLQRWMAEGRVAQDSLVWREGWAEWRAADQVFRSRDSQPIGSDFEIDPRWLMPAGAARESAPGESLLDDGPGAAERIRSKHYQKTVIIILIAAIAILLPALVYVVFFGPG